MARARKPTSRRSIPARRSVPTVRRITDRAWRTHDLYHRLLTMPWTGFFAVLAMAYVLFNMVFGLLFMADEGAIANARPGSFADAFFFSVQTMATIGYGDMRPHTLYSNLLVTVEVLMGLTGLALATGVIFARFSRPTARIMFSRVAVISPHNGVPTLMFRAANQRKNRILEAQVTVSILRQEATAEGGEMRRFHDLPLVRSRTPMFALTWTVMHVIDKQSPLYGATREALEAEHAELIVTLVGIDDSFSQTIYGRHSYVAEEIVWNRRFADILGRLEDGTSVVDYRRFHDVEALDG